MLCKAHGLRFRHVRPPSCCLTISMGHLLIVDFGPAAWRSGSSNRLADTLRRRPYTVHTIKVGGG